MKISSLLLGLILLLLIVVPVCADPTNWTYSTPGTFYWVCPATVTNIVMQISGSGGGGMGGGYWGPSYHYGTGGANGENGVFADIGVTPGANYTFVVAPGGAASTINTGVAHSGSSSFALGHTAAGGVSGTGVVTSGHNGGDGGTGLSGTVGNSVVGGNCADLSYMGGVNGTGAGGGGGGGAGKNLYDYPGAGGKGSDGLIKIFITGSPGIPVNQPNFEADITNGYPGTLITFRDTSIITDSSNMTYAWNFGDYTNSSTIGNVTHIYSYLGTFTVTLTITYGTGTVVSTSKDAYIAVTTQPSQNYGYTPNQPRFTVLDYKGNSVPNALVSATYDSTTLPDAIQYLTTTYNIPPAIASQMLTTGATMSGVTGSDGAVVFTMHSSLRYNITAINGTTSISSMVFPKDPDYNLWLPAPTVENLYEQINATLTFTEPNSSYMTLGTRYQDHAGKTSALYFYVNSTNGTAIYSTTVNPGTALTLLNKTIPNVRGQSYWWGIRATRTGGNLSLDQGVTGKGPNGVLVDLRLPDTKYYPWISLMLLFLVTSLASKNNLRFMAILMPAMAAMFWWFGWLSGTYLTGVIPFACLIGVTYYMKGSLRENYGTGGPGSLLLNIVVFVIILQMMVGFINGLGVFDQTSIMTPQNQFMNVDLTSIRGDMSNFAGLNDPIQSATSFTSIGWTILRVAVNMIGAALVVGLYLAEMFPYFPVEFFVIIQAGVYILYVLFLLKLVAKSGTESDF